jgi:hypothetical protein
MSKKAQLTELLRNSDARCGIPQEGGHIMKTETKRGRWHAMMVRLCTGVAFFGIVSPVSADMVTVTYTGAVRDGFDQLARIIHDDMSLGGGRRRNRPRHV